MSVYICKRWSLVCWQLRDKGFTLSINACHVHPTTPRSKPSAQLMANGRGISISLMSTDLMESNLTRDIQRHAQHIEARRDKKLGEGKVKTVAHHKK